MREWLSSVIGFGIEGNSTTYVKLYENIIENHLD